MRLVQNDQNSRIYGESARHLYSLLACRQQKRLCDRWSVKLTARPLLPDSRAEFGQCRKRTRCGSASSAERGRSAPAWRCVVPQIASRCWARTCASCPRSRASPRATWRRWARCRATCWSAATTGMRVGGHRPGTQHRDVCHYCTFAEAPRSLVAPYMSADDAVALCSEPGLDVKLTRFDGAVLAFAGGLPDASHPRSLLA